MLLDAIVFAATPDATLLAATLDAATFWSVDSPAPVGLGPVNTEGGSFGFGCGTVCGREVLEGRVADRGDEGNALGSGKEHAVLLPQVWGQRGSVAGIGGKAPRGNGG